MLSFLLFVLFSTSVVSAEESCKESEVTFRDCLRISGGLSVDNSDLTEQMANIEDCGAHESKCYLQTEVIKMMKAVIRAQEEDDINDPKVIACHKKIADRYNRKCYRSRYDDDGFPMSFIEASLNHQRCYMKYARKSNICGKATMAKVLKASGHDGSTLEYMLKLRSLGQYLREYTD